MDLYEELMAKIKQLESSVKQLRALGTSYAAMEKDSKVLLRQEVLKMRDAGMAVGVIELTCYGIPSVAEARFKRDTALTVYEACKEAIQSLKLQIRIIESQIQREYGIAGKGDI